MKEILKENNLAETCVFGDSPNDEPMFSFFPNSCAVANILPFVEKMDHLPRLLPHWKAGKDLRRQFSTFFVPVNWNEHRPRSRFLAIDLE